MVSHFDKFEETIAIMNPETLPPLHSFSEAMETELLTTISLDETTDTFPSDEEIDYETLRVFYGAGF